jgi:hypothetical protein
MTKRVVIGGMLPGKMVGWPACDVYFLEEKSCSPVRCMWIIRNENKCARSVRIRAGFLILPIIIAIRLALLEVFEEATSMNTNLRQ